MDYGIVLAAPDGAIATIALSYHATTSEAEYLLIGEAETLFVGGGRVTRSGETLLEADLATQMARAVASQDAAFIDAISTGGAFPMEGRSTLPTLRVQDTVQRAGATPASDPRSPPTPEPAAGVAAGRAQRARSP
jgi:2-hydroxy-4-carboxymuconate semialdehyde hemiacetal dehydrogenase